MCQLMTIFGIYLVQDVKIFMDHLPPPHRLYFVVFGATVLYLRVLNGSEWFSVVLIVLGGSQWYRVVLGYLYITTGHYRLLQVDAG